MTQNDLYKKLRKLKGEWASSYAMKAIGYPYSRQRFHILLTNLIQEKKVKKIHRGAYISH